MGDHRGEEGEEGEPERKIANALAGVKAWGLHGGVGGVVVGSEL
jgi:hypothetical protein